MIIITGMELATRGHTNSRIQGQSTVHIFNFVGDEDDQSQIIMTMYT